MEDQNKPEELQYEIVNLNSVDATTLSTLAKAEIDMQISTAKAYPRSIATFLKKVESLATITQPIAESCTYALPRKERDKSGNYVTKIINGPSVRFAEIVCSQYGNIRAGARVVSNDGRYITAQGFCHDLETNVVTALEVKRKITTKDGKTFSEDMQVITGNAACKIAYRNAVFTVIPAALLTEVYEKVQEVSKGTAETLPARRDKAIKFFVDKGIKDEQIFDVLNVKAKEDIDLEKLQVLSGMKAMIHNQETTLESLFPAPDPNRDKANQANDSVLASMKAATSKAKNKNNNQNASNENS